MAFLTKFRATPFGSLGRVRFLVTDAKRKSSAGADSESTSTGYANGHNHESQDEILKDEILTLALKHVNSKGWNRDAIQAGAEELDISGEVCNIFTEYELVKFFIKKSNEEMESHLNENKMNLREALKWRLEKVVPYAPKFNEALAYITQPENLPNSLKLLESLADSIAHHSLADKSTSISWYTRRAGIASIYVASELHLVQDKSENFQDTWKFLERRVSDFDRCSKSSFPFQTPLPTVISATFATALNLMGLNKRR